MIPREFLVPYLVSNTVALLLLVTAFRRPQVTRWVCVLMFAGAAIVNARLALMNPAEYVLYGALAVSAVYRDFIYGWFSRHVQLLVVPIAAGQLFIAVLLAQPRPWRRLGVAGASIFLLAIAPLAVGAAFPFSVTLIAALLVMEKVLGRQETDRHRTPPGLPISTKGEPGAQRYEARV